MDHNVIIGSLVIAGALLALIILTLGGRRTIDKIAEDGYRTARQTIRERNHTNQNQKNNAQQLTRGRKNVK